MKKMFTYTACAVVALGITSTSVAATTKTAAENSTSQAAAATYLFVIGGKGKIVKSSDAGSYVLHMKIPNMNQVIMFADRPYRMVNYISAASLFSLWDKGNNSFYKNPPNAVLSAYGMKPVIITLNGMDYKNNTVTFKFTDNTGNSRIKLNELLNGVVLTIDQSSIMSGFCSSFTFTDGLSCP